MECGTCENFRDFAVKFNQICGSVSSVLILLWLGVKTVVMLRIHDMVSRTKNIRTSVKLTTHCPRIRNEDDTYYVPGTSYGR